MRNFRSLKIWQESLVLVKQVYEITSTFPKSEMYGLQSQIQRAGVSIPANISEGCSRTSELEFVRFLEIALGSAYELETHFEIARLLGYVSDDSSESLFRQVKDIQVRIGNFRHFVKKQI